MDVGVTDSGRVLVVTSEAPSLRMFDRTGKVVWTAGRTGTGPGEYRLPIRAAIGPRVIQVVDMSLRRITRLQGDGTVIGSAPVTGFPAAVGARGRSGEMVVVLDDFRNTFRLQRWGIADSGVTIGTVPRSASTNASDLTIPSIAVDQAGRMAVLRDPDEYRIVLMAPDGQSVGELTRDIPRVKRTAAEIAAIERRRAASRQRVATELGRSGASPPVLRAPADELKPHIAINGLRYDDAGLLWAKTMRGNESSTVFDIFAPDRRYLGEVTVPAAIGTFSIAGRWFVADVESEDGTPRIWIWQLR
jgi:hypothetical protein